MTLFDPFHHPGIEPERVPAHNHGPPDQSCAATGTRFSIAEAQIRARDIRYRLRNPANAVKDMGIDLRRHRKATWLKPTLEPLSREQVSPSLRYLAWPLQEVILRPIDFDGRITVRHIVNIVCQDYGLKDEIVCKKKRSGHYILPRHICMYLAKLLTDQSWVELGRRFQRDHSAVIYAFRKIEGLRITEDGFAAHLDHLTAKVRA